MRNRMAGGKSSGHPICAAKSLELRPPSLLSTTSAFGEMEQNMIQKLDVLRREIKVLTFDQYGTIVDMQQGS